MISRTCWITATICFLVGIITGGVSIIFKDAGWSVYLALLNRGFTIAGWAIWAIGLVIYFHEK